MVTRSTTPTRDPLALDYQWTNEQIKLLTDIRFRLLVLVPPLVTIGVTLLSSQSFGAVSPFALFGVGLLGVSVTFGVVLYDLRNSQLYDSLIHRAALIEREMRMKPLFKGSLAGTWGGPYAMRISGFGRLFWIFPINHGMALSLIYGAVLGAWFYPISKGLLVVMGSALKNHGWKTIHRGLLIENSGMLTTICALIIAVILGMLLTCIIKSLDQPGLAGRLIYRDVNRPIARDEFEARSDEFLEEHVKGGRVVYYAKKIGLIRARRRATTPSRSSQPQRDHATGESDKPSI
jgi:hypothetical protein